MNAAGGEKRRFLFVKKSAAERVRRALHQRELLDTTIRIIATESEVAFPLTSVRPKPLLEEVVDHYPDVVQVDEVGGWDARVRAATPFETIVHRLELPETLRNILPRRWERIGDILKIKLHPTLEPYATSIGAVYGTVLDAKTVIVVEDGIHGQYREPSGRIIYGEETETVHRENGIDYALDVAQIMFSSGNIDERIHMGTVAGAQERVVDLFAGIGYFTLPLAVHSRPRSIIACELNPVAYGYLVENIERNDVADIVEPRLGDCRLTAPTRAADRVVMGYIKRTAAYLDTAFEALAPAGGVIHYHDVVAVENIDHLIERLIDAAAQYHWHARIARRYRLKSYAPGIVHLVVDLELY